MIATQNKHRTNIEAESDARNGQTTEEQAKREYRRKLAWKLFNEEGMRKIEIARLLGVSKGAVSQWTKAANEGGEEALEHKKPTGRPPLLDGYELDLLDQLIQHNPEAYGFAGEVWTRKRVGKVISMAFEVHFSEQHVGNILRRLGFSRQKPRVKAAQRDETKIEEWKETVLPEIKKSLKIKKQRSAS